MTGRRVGARGWPAALGVVSAVSAVALTAGGCAVLEEEAAAVHQPGTAEEVDGQEVKLVRLDADAARRVSLRTAVARRKGDHTVVPYAALIYDPAGKVWVYTNPERLTYQRAAVQVDRVTGTRALLARGPAAGSRVVTVGATELYGVELDIAGGH